MAEAVIDERCNESAVPASPGLSKALLEDQMLAQGAIELDRPTDRPSDRRSEPSPARPVTRATPEEAAALFEAYGDRVRRYVAFRVRDPQDAEDLTADVFRRVMSGPLPVDGAVRPAWLFRVAHHVVIDHYRRRRFTIPLLGMIDRPDDAPSLPDHAVRDERLREVDRALATLVGRQRAAIYLRFYEELDYAEIATVMDVPAVTARSLVHRGLRILATRLSGGDR